MTGPAPLTEYLLRRFTLPGDVLLDVGCGPALYRHTTAARYIGLDIVDASKELDEPGNVDVIASAEAIPLTASSIDVVFSKSAFFQVSCPEKVLTEFLRVLKPGGRVLLQDYNRRTQKRLSISEGAVRPCWSQWGLKELVKNAGFRECELVAPVAGNVAAPEKWVRLVLQEWIGTWAIVIGVK